MLPVAFMPTEQGRRYFVPSNAARASRVGHTTTGCSEMNSIPTSVLAGKAASTSG
jgi:hypothetical protein